MARRYGRAPRGQRLRAGVPHGHWKTTTFVAGLRLTGLVAPFVLDGPINRDAFEVYAEKVLVPELSPGDVVVMDNLSSHKGPNARADRKGRRYPALPAALQSRLQSNRERLCQLKALLRKAAEPTERLWRRSAGSSKPHPIRARQEDRWGTRGGLVSSKQPAAAGR